MANFGSFWIGGPRNGPLTKLQWVSLASYIYHGHSFTLYVYDENLLVPEGVIKKDAREIMREDELFYAKGQPDGLGKDLPAPSADLFRYRLLNAVDTIWSDCDMLCFSDDFSFIKDDYLFSIEPNTKCVNGDLLKLPRGSAVLLDLIQKAEDYPKKSIKWAEIGPFLITTVFENHNILNKEIPFHMTHVFTNEEWYKYWQPEYKEEVIDKCRNAKTASIYNALATYHISDRNSFPVGSALEYFYNKFVKGK